MHSRIDTVPGADAAVVACGGIAACDIGFNSIQAPHASFPIKLLLVLVMIPANTALTWRFGLLGAALGVSAFSSLTAILLARNLRAVWQGDRLCVGMADARPEAPAEGAS